MGKVKNKISKIIIAGANGQLGRCLQDVSDIYPNYDFYFKTSKELDITKKEQIDILFAQEKFDYCINCAAYTAVDKAEIDNENAYMVNAEAVKYLAEVCKAHNTTLIHISTDFVFDGTKCAPYTEDDLPNPINVYGASKLKGEQYIKEILNNYFIIRTSWVYSEYGHNFVKTMLRFAQERDEISVVNDQIGSPTYAPDLAVFLLTILDHPNVNFGIYNYSNQGEISWFDFASEIFKLRELHVKCNAIPTTSFLTSARRPMNSILCKQKATNTIGVNIPFWKESLKKCLRPTSRNHGI